MPLSGRVFPIPAALDSPCSARESDRSDPDSPAGIVPVDVFDPEPYRTKARESLASRKSESLASRKSAQLARQTTSDGAGLSNTKRESQSGILKKSPSAHSSDGNRHSDGNPDGFSAVVTDGGSTPKKQKGRATLLMPQKRNSSSSNESGDSNLRQNSKGKALFSKVSSSIQSVKQALKNPRTSIIKATGGRSKTQDRLQHLSVVRNQGAFLSVLGGSLDHATTFHVRMESDEEDAEALIDQVFTKIVKKGNDDEDSWRIPAMSTRATLCRKLLKILAVLSAGLSFFDVAFADTCYQNPAEKRVLQAMRALQITSGLGYTLISIAVRVGTTVVSVEQGMEYVDTPHILMWHLTSYKLYVDAVAALGVIFEVVQFHQPQRWGSLLNLARLWRCFERSSFQSERNFAQQVAKLVAYLCMLAHTWACGWTVFTIPNARRGEHSWADELLKQDCGCRDLYAASLYFVTCTITGVGYGDIVAGSPMEQVKSVILMLAGALAMAKVFADLTWITATHNHWTAEHFSKVTQMFIALENLGVQDRLRRRVLAYQEYAKLCARERAVHRFLDELSIPLQTELKLAIYHQLVVGASLFSEASLEVIRLVITSLQDRVYMPFDFLFREGCPGDELFLMRTGCVAILAGPGAYAVPIDLRKPGDHFGEIAVILGTTRRSWAMARTYVITSVLHKDVIDDLQVNYPEAFVHIVKEVKSTACVSPKVSLNQLADLLAEKFRDTADAFASIIASQPAATKEATATDFIKAMLDLGLSRFDALLLWSELDEDSSGSIDYDEFCNMCSKDGPRKSMVKARTLKKDVLQGNSTLSASGNHELFSANMIFTIEDGEGDDSSKEELSEDKAKPAKDSNQQSGNKEQSGKKELTVIPGEDDEEGTSPEASPKSRRELPKMPIGDLENALQKWRSAKVQQKKIESSERPLCRETVRAETLNIADKAVESFSKDLNSLKGQMRELHQIMDGILDRSGKSFVKGNKIEVQPAPISINLQLVQPPTSVVRMTTDDVPKKKVDRRSL